MKPAPFEYHVPRTLEEALTLLAELGDDAMALAGGQSLVPMLNLRLAYAEHLIDLNRLDELAYIRDEGDVLAVGAMTRQEVTLASHEVHASAPLMAEALPHVAYPAIRSRGTIGGSVANADPKAELPCVVVAAGGSVVLASASGRREVAGEEFFVGPYTTARSYDELVVEVRLPKPAEGAVTAFEEVSRSAGEFALTLVGVTLVCEADRCTRATIAVAGATGASTRARGAEQALIGAALTAETLASAARLVQDDIEPIGDGHGSADYRRRVTAVAARRALSRAAGQAMAVTA